MGENLYSEMLVIETVEDLRALFSADAQFVNLDGAYEENYGENEICPFDELVKENENFDLGSLAHVMGEGLADFDTDFQSYQVNVLDVGKSLVVSYAVMIEETY